MASRAHLRTLIAGALIASVTACGGSTTPATTPPTPTCTVTSLTVTPPSSELVVGATAQLAAAVSSSNCTTAPQTSWISSSSMIASVSSTGLVTAAAEGTALITATASGVSGSAAITVKRGATATLTVSSVKPAAAATEVAVDSVVRLTFSEAIDAATVTATSVTVSKSGTVVPGALTVAGTVVTFKPTASLTEFATVYSIAVTVGVKATTGNFLAAPFAATFTTAMWDPAYYYRITNEFGGKTKALDTFSNTLECGNLDIGNFSGQAWYFVPITGVSATYYFKNAFQGDTKALEGGTPGSPCLMTGLAAGNAYFTGQAWKVTLFGALYPNGYRLQNANFGTAQSLDLPQIGGVNRPSLQPTGNFLGQIWYFTRSEHR
jgi:Bacterial Ig-like domain/Bacterial Ig-like domain (group 2)